MLPSRSSLRKIAWLTPFVLAFTLAACDRASEDEQIAELEQQLSNLEGQLDQTEAALAESEDVKPSWVKSSSSVSDARRDPGQVQGVTDSAGDPSGVLD